MTLKQGDVFRMHPDCGDTSTYIVLRVNEGSAAVRCQNQQHIVIPNDVGGTKADFWKAGRPFHISRNASVVLVEEESHEEQDECSCDDRNCHHHTMPDGEGD